MKDFRGFESWDETYVHTKHHDQGRTVLEYRIDDKGKEPWTWVKTHGQGRIFYTAWGHDARTWTNPGFQTLLERGIRWVAPLAASRLRAPGEREAASGPPQMTPKRTDVKPFEYVDVGNKIPNYEPGKGRDKVQAFSKMQVPLDAAESQKHMVTPVDFEVKLFAADPQIRRPICMNWDERGRLWIAESVDYPNERKPAGEGNDRIVICEDTDGDGKADKFTVFADKLSIPTGFTFYKGGIIVLQAPDTLYLKDTSGDDVADERKVLFTGWHTNDTHAGPSNLRWGFDNWVYGIVGYAGFDGEVGGERHSFRQGFFRFKPDGSKLEFLRNTNNNSWGLGFSEEGLLFGSTANGNPSVYMPIPNRYYEKVRGWSSSVVPSMAGNAEMHPITEKVRQVDWHGHFTAAAGHALYTARTYPKQYWNRTAFVCEPTGHLVATFQIDGNGTDFTSRNAWNLLASDDEWTAPIMAEVGPDGNVWVIDWYNYIVQHNPTPIGFKNGPGNAYETDLRDKKHGRIYRIVVKGAKDAAPMSLKDATPQQLVAALKSDNLFWRMHAQRLLVERGKADIVQKLQELIEDDRADELGLNPGAVHALWVLDGLGDGAKDAKIACGRGAIKHRCADVRRNAWLVLGKDADSDLLFFDRRDTEPDAHVRLAWLLAMTDASEKSRGYGRFLARYYSFSSITWDRWLVDALTIAAAQNDVMFLADVLRNRQLAARVLEITPIVAEHLARRGDEKMINLVVSLLPDGPKEAEIILASMAKGWPRNTKLELWPNAEKAMQDVLPKLSPAGRGQLFRLASVWGSKTFANQAEEIARSLLSALRDGKLAEAQRLDAARQLVDVQAGDVKAVGALLELISPRTPSSLATGLLDVLGSSASPAVPPALLQRYAELTPTVRDAALRVLLSRPEGTKALLGALEKGGVAFNDLTLDQRQALAVHPDKGIATRAKKLLERGGGLPSADRQKVVDELMPLTKRTGDAELGKLVFKKHCATCHTHSGEGAKVGPDLTGMAAHPKSELVVHIMDPSRSVEGNFRVYTLTTQDGIVLSGLLASESKTSVELIDSQAKKHTVQRDNIEQLVASNKSLMPEGFEKQVTPDEFVNLLEFLTKRGQFLPLALDKAATIVSTQGMFHAKDAGVERLVLPDWGPKTFQGVPFQLVDPKGDKVPNVILLYSKSGNIPQTMPKSVKLTYTGPAKAIHLLSGISGWGFPGGKKGSVSMTVRLHYADGTTEDHPLRNGEHFADYIRRVDVPGSEFAFPARGQQVRYLAVHPKREGALTAIEFIKGDDATAPVVVAVTVETKP
jgi:putative membrane-bound dehydrogenase-like protein